MVQLAAVDLDWEHVRAVDIFAALRSFLPSGGALKSVTVYPSDYGLQRMKEDARAGPQVPLSSPIGCLSATVVHSVINRSVAASLQRLFPQVGCKSVSTSFRSAEALTIRDWVTMRCRAVLRVRYAGHL